jgi:hypothetical protein
MPAGGGDEFGRERESDLVYDAYSTEVDNVPKWTK